MNKKNYISKTNFNNDKNKKNFFDNLKEKLNKKKNNIKKKKTISNSLNTFKNCKNKCKLKKNTISSYFYKNIIISNVGFQYSDNTCYIDSVLFLMFSFKCSPFWDFLCNNIPKDGFDNLIIDAYKKSNLVKINMLIGKIYI